MTDSMEVAHAVLSELTAWRTQHHCNFPGVIRLSVTDARNLDEEHKRNLHEQWPDEFPPPV